MMFSNFCIILNLLISFEYKIFSHHHLLRLLPKYIIFSYFYTYTNSIGYCSRKKKDLFTKLNAWHYLVEIVVLILKYIDELVGCVWILGMYLSTPSFESNTQNSLLGFKKRNPDYIEIRVYGYACIKLDVSNFEV